MSKIGFTDQQWAFIQPLLPPPARTGRPRANDRRAIEGILYILITGCRWQDLPRGYGAPTTVWRRLKRWGEGGIWERIWRAALATLDQQGKLDWSSAFLGGSFAPAKKGGEKVGLTKKGKGTKWMMVVEGNRRRAPPRRSRASTAACDCPRSPRWAGRCARRPRARAAAGRRRGPRRRPPPASGASAHGRCPRAAGRAAASATVPRSAPPSAGR